MNRNINIFAFVVGLVAVLWVAVGYIGGSGIALAVSCIIALVYIAGGVEMQRYHSNTGALARALGNIPDDLAHLGEWLQQVPPALQNTVRQRIEGERVALPGPSITPYLVGLLVLLGMLGTFLGMVVTLNGAVLALESTTDLHTIRAALAAPVKGLGVAFGTSVAGVAASAMLGLISALCRRNRLQVGQLLDSKIASVLRDFSLAHQRQETFKALQSQAQTLPDLVGRLETLMVQMAEQSRQQGEALLASQQSFHLETKGLYTDLAQSVAQSLQASLRDGAKLAAEAIQPVVTATMSGIAGETRGLHDKLFGTVETQLGGLTRQLDQSIAKASEMWQGALAEHTRASEAQQQNLQTTLGTFAGTLDERSQALLASVENKHAAIASELTTAHAQFARTAQEQQVLLAQQVGNQLDGIAARFDGAVTSVAHTWSAALSKHEEASEHLTCALDHTQTALAGIFAERTGALLSEMGAAQAAWQSEWSAGEQARQASFTEALTAMAAKLESQWQQAGEATLGQQEQITRALGDTARELVAATQRQAEATIAEVTRLMQTAAEAPKAAAEVIGQLRQELTASMARDNGLLEERSRIMETLGTLLDAINHASTEQRSAIDALVASSADLLERAGRQFAAKVDSETGKLVDMGASIAGGALEVASLGEAFGHAVGLFSAANDKMMVALQRIEGALAKSLSRSDEQLAYYVAQAREIIDLSIMSQKQIVDDLHRAAGRSAAAGEG